MTGSLVAAYRVQLRNGVDFDLVAALCPYLAALGVSHLYLSPYLTAAPNSVHGYDVTDPSTVDEALGGADGYRRLLTALDDNGLRLLVDLVPNHMSISQGSNPWWQDVLASGPGTARAGYFDINWESPDPRLAGRVLVPVLAQSYGATLAAGKFHLARVGTAIELRFDGERFPVTLASLAETLGEIADGPREASALVQALTGPDAGNLQGANGAAVGEYADGRALETQLADLDSALAAIAKNHLWMDRLLQRQWYRLARWQAGSQDLNYRRFFDVDSLVGVRIEEEQVFRDHHGPLLKSLDPTAGLRVDHPDGLRDPQEYLGRLRRDSPQRWIVVEKILAPGEDLPVDWPVEGTTGYDFARLATGLFVDRAAEASLTDTYRHFTGEGRAFAEVAHESKRQVVKSLFGSDLNRLTDQLVRIAEASPEHRDCSRHEVRETLAELAAALPVYRTYLRPGMSRAAATRAAAPLQVAVDLVASGRPDLDRELLRFAGDVLSLRVGDPVAEDLALRFQQLTGAVTAKGVEDTAYYRYHRLISLNEVGDDPRRFGVGIEEFHSAMAARQRQQPLSMNATSTHDSKRSEDVRCRINVISEMPEAWARAVRRWSRCTALHRGALDLPDRNFEYFFYQTLVGAWPISLERILAVVEKSVREAKVHTSWRLPNPGYEAAVIHFVTCSLRDPVFTRSVAAFVGRIDTLARISSLAVSLLKVTAPGVPDVYQGTEVWNYSLVDPDNRRPVDFDSLGEQLLGLESISSGEIARSGSPGLLKLWVLSRALKVRGDMVDAMGPSGEYLPLAVEGRLRGHLVAFARGGRVVTLVPRLALATRGGWEDATVRLPRGQWVDKFTGARFAGGSTDVGRLLGAFPVALLVAEGRA